MSVLSYEEGRALQIAVINCQCATCVIIRRTAEDGRLRQSLSNPADPDTAASIIESFVEKSEHRQS